MAATITAKTYDRQTATFLAVVGQNMPEISSDIMQGWIENPKALQKALRTALLPPDASVAMPREFTTWKTIKIGTQKFMNDLTNVLMANGFRISGEAGYILKKIALASTEREIELVLISVADLGFTKAICRDAIYHRAKELGLDLVPAEVGPQLRLTYIYQPLNEWMLIAMEPIADSDGSLRVFHLEYNDDGRWLYGGMGDPDFAWLPSVRWVFARHK